MYLPKRVGFSRCSIAALAGRVGAIHESPPQEQGLPATREERRCMGLPRWVGRRTAERSGKRRI